MRVSLVTWRKQLKTMVFSPCLRELSWTVNQATRPSWNSLATCPIRTREALRAAEKSWRDYDLRT